MATNKTNSILQFIGGIILLVIGILTLFSDMLTLNVVTYIVLFTILAYGLLQIVLTFRSDEKARIGHLILGIILVLLVILAFYNIRTFEVGLLIYAYVFFGMAFMFISASSLTNHLTNFKDHNFIWTIVLIVLDVLVLIFSIMIFFMPVAELTLISFFISLSLIFAGSSQIANAFDPQIGY